MLRFSIAIVVASLVLTTHAVGAQSPAPPTLGFQHSVRLLSKIHFPSDAALERIIGRV
jgi:hypothetical protein